MRGQDDASIVAGWFGKKHCCSCNQFSFGSNYAIGLLLQACTWGQKVKEGHKITQMRSTGGHHPIMPFMPLLPVCFSVFCFSIHMFAWHIFSVVLALHDSLLSNRRVGKRGICENGSAVSIHYNCFRSTFVNASKIEQ